MNFDFLRTSFFIEHHLAASGDSKKKLVQNLSLCFVISRKLIFETLQKQPAFNQLTHFRPMFHLCRNQVVGLY